VESRVAEETEVGENPYPCTSQNLTPPQLLWHGIVVNETLLLMHHGYNKNILLLIFMLYEQLLYVAQLLICVTCKMQ
jgi:hypothetical protein